MKNFLLFLILLASPVFAVDHYISPTGTDSGDCTGSNCRTFAYALASARMPAGDRLILRNGTYSASAGTGYIAANCASGYNNGTASLPITVKAENERMAFIQSEDTNGAALGGSTKPILIQNCSYWTLDGLRAEGSDTQGESGIEAGTVVLLAYSSNITVKRGLFRFNNRYINCHLLRVFYTNNSLIEENEVYSNHRHGIAVHFGSNNVLRRNYVNSRGRADIPIEQGGEPSHQANSGDDGLNVYPGSNNIFENNISEWQNRGMTVLSAQSSAPAASSTGNRLYGNITIKSSVAFGTGEYPGLSRPIDTLFQDSLAITSTYWGIGGTGTNTRYVNASNIDATIGGSAGGFGFRTDCAATCDLSFTNALTNTSDSTDTTGFSLNTPFATYTGNYLNAYGFGTPYSPTLPNANITNATTTDPNLGSCKAWIPQSSPMKGAGLAGADKGANILYQYQNGVLTSTPLWNTTTNNFTGCGAVIAGVNDSAGDSCDNVDIRLSIGTVNGCAFPAGYTTPAPPPPGGPWISFDTFDSYTLGADLGTLNGGTGWSAAWAATTPAITIAAAPPGGQGGNAAFINADPTVAYVRTLTGISAGFVRFKFYPTSITPGGEVNVLLGDASGGRCVTSIAADGNFKLFDGTTNFSIGPYVANAWNTVDLEFNDVDQPDKCRARLESGVWTQWFTVSGGSYTTLDRFRIDTGTGFAAQLYIDDIREGSTASVISTISVIDAGLAGGGMFAGEVRKLEWSSTDLTGNVDLLVTRDNGATFQMAAQGVPNTCATGGLNGCYNWTVSGPASTQCKVKVRSSSNTAVESVSASFSIYGTHLKIR